MSADPYCAKTHSSSAPSTEDLLTDANGGLENVVVFVSGGLEAATFPVPDEPVMMEQKGCQYKPHVLAMRAGQKLKVVNDDATAHNIHPMPNNNREWNVSQPAGTPVEQVFAREEVAISVKCNIHPWMRSYIAVVKNPYFAVTDKNGAFELKDLPPGDIYGAGVARKTGHQDPKNHRRRRRNQAGRIRIPIADDCGSLHAPASGAILTRARRVLSRVRKYD